MKYLVAYYSRTGTTKKLAEVLSSELGADLEEIKEPTDRAGVLGYVRSGREAMRKSLPEILPTLYDLADYDVVILGSPVWAGTYASPLRSYIEKNKGKFKKVALFATQGSSSEQKIFTQMESQLSIKPSAKIFFTTKSVRNDEFKAGVIGFVTAIKQI